MGLLYTCAESLIKAQVLSRKAIVKLILIYRHWSLTPPTHCKSLLVLTCYVTTEDRKHHHDGSPLVMMVIYPRPSGLFKTTDHRTRYLTIVELYWTCCNLSTCRTPQLGGQSGRQVSILTLRPLENLGSLDETQNSSTCADYPVLFPAGQSDASKEDTQNEWCGSGFQGMMVNTWHSIPRRRNMY